MDDESKNNIVDELSHVHDDFRNRIISAIKPTPSDIQRIQIKEFLTQFSERRADLSLEIFPKSFLKWVGI